MSAPRPPDHRFTDRHGGVSAPPFATANLGDHVGDDRAAVAENRWRVADTMGAQTVTWMGQVHGRRVAVVDAPRGRGPGNGPARDPVPGVDGLVTSTPGLVLGVLVADCVPVLLSAPGLAAVAHAGRKGLQLGVVPAVLGVVASHGVDPGALTVRLGPAVCGDCYEVPSDMRDEVAAAAPGSASRTATGSPSLDLRAGLVRQLRAAGVRRLEVSRICTVESPDHFSYRRDGSTGRFAGLVRCRPGAR